MNEERHGSDVTGRVMSLEQRLGGIQGRVGALEARVSGGDTAERIPEDVEFIPAYVEESGMADVIKRLEALESRPPPGPWHDTLDVSGVVGGAALIGAGVLLAAGSFDLLKNPLLAFGTGVALLAGAGMRRLWKKRP